MELRKDYILNRYVIVSEARGKRPHELFPKKIEEVGICMFCPGNESMTPPEIARIGDGKGGWRIRIFPNKFPAALPEGQPAVRTDNRFFSFADAYGIHEIVVETADHKKQLADLSSGELTELLSVWIARIAALRALPNINYVSVFKNHGLEAGTSIVHSHTQIIAHALPPPAVLEELSAIKSWPSCPYCDIIAIEKGSLRRCFENERFVAFTPYASRFHYEVWIFPKEHINELGALDQASLAALAQIMKATLARLASFKAPYNMFLHWHPDSAYHFHIEICPRTAIWAGFEFCSGIVINSMSPEEAARFYRGE